MSLHSCGARRTCRRRTSLTIKPSRGRRRAAAYCFVGWLATTLQPTSAWDFADFLSWLWEQPEVPEPPYNFTVVYGEQSGEEWVDGSYVANLPSEFSSTRPRPWNSSRCMAKWNMSQLQMEVDPMGYVVFSEGREQLGNNRFLISDGIAIAKVLDRTLVEFPMKNSRIHTPDAELGLCAYWDCENLCNYHRILDLETFRAMLRDGRVDPGGFVSLISGRMEKNLLPNLVTTESITDFFWNYQQSQVIVMNMAWKSELRREPVDLLRPNPFYRDLVYRLIKQQRGWEDGNFLAVQWRTEMSVGNLTDCYFRYVKPAVEAYREAFGWTIDQVFFNTDLVGQASTTYNATVIQANQGMVWRVHEHYPSSMDNTVYDVLISEEDAGVRAMISGLVSASAGLLLSSSFNGSGDSECQKPHSKYIDLLVEWRLDEDFFNNSVESIVKLFPELVEDDPPAVAQFFNSCMWVLLCFGMCAGVAMVVANRTGVGVLDVFNTKHHDA